jgi:hypothetical protein
MAIVSNFGQKRLKSCEIGPKPPEFGSKTAICSWPAAASTPISADLVRGQERIGPERTAIRGNCRSQRTHKRRFALRAARAAKDKSLGNVAPSPKLLRTITVHPDESFSTKVLPGCVLFPSADGFASRREAGKNPSHACGQRLELHPSPAFDGFRLPNRRLSSGP